MYPQNTQYAPPMPQFPQQHPYAPQQYPQPYASPQSPPQQPAVSGTLDGFFNQPSGGGGPSWKFHNKPQGTTYSGIVARAITNADVRQQTDPNGRPLTYKDGRPKFVMVVPMRVNPDQEFPEGIASWWVKGQARDELVRAMSEAGAPEGPPEAGAAISVTLVGQRPVPGMNPQYQYRVQYQRPAQAAPEPVASTPAPAAEAAPNANGLDPNQQALLNKLSGASA